VRKEKTAKKTSNELSDAGRGDQEENNGKNIRYAAAAWKSSGLCPYQRGQGKRMGVQGREKGRLVKGPVRVEKASYATFPPHGGVVVHSIAETEDYRRGIGDGVGSNEGGEGWNRFITTKRGGAALRKKQWRWRHFSPRVVENQRGI